MILDPDANPVAGLERKDLAENYDLQVRMLAFWLSDPMLRKFLVDEKIMALQEIASLAYMIDEIRRTKREIVSRREIRNLLFVLLSSWKCRKIIAAGTYTRAFQRGKMIPLKNCIRELRDLRADLEEIAKRDVVLVGGN